MNFANANVDSISYTSCLSNSGSVDLNESRNISIDYEKASSLSSDEGMHGAIMLASPSKIAPPQCSPTRPKVTTSNTLFVQPMINLGQSLPNLNLNSANVCSSNTLLVPGVARSGGGSSTHSNLLSPSHRGISYPPPSPTR